jgi:putative transposase
VVCGAVYGERSEERMNTPQWLLVAGMGHPGRENSLAIPEPRQGSYFPDWLLERRRRAEPR